MEECWSIKVNEVKVLLPEELQWDVVHMDCTRLSKSARAILENPGKVVVTRHDWARFN
uniref:Uncharacterized protein n=1 Tax=Romanomermis culicivorax TaxID=13658 RepID=A0A915IQX9_ROMCU